MSKTEDFLTKAEEKEIVEAIIQAEKNTSGEIRVHIEENNQKPPLERAQEVFHHLGMDKTGLRNGVLFYVCMQSRTFAVIGDKGINDLVESDFWDCTKDAVVSNFKQGQFKNGLVSGILRAGERLKEHFPFEDDDTNELSNEISRG
ncbi:TPM domain-containing protein [Flavobacterium amniphilum]|uniref:TPM domain-containing protein n=1 Tax=Flavobacterium amniphilum TaxID=1834035 RepID=UPI002029FD64|nr:TPM domain-containing protein [Flavobacterium amniphilum]MCL9804637.1 TPM domain-containing protein [Flavobacterium amniphilum]